MLGVSTKSPLVHWASFLLMRLDFLVWLLRAIVLMLFWCCIANGDRFLNEFNKLELLMIQLQSCGTKLRLNKQFLMCGQISNSNECKFTENRGAV